MSDESGPKQPERIAKALRLSLAGYVAVCIATGLIVLTIAAWILFHAQPQRVAWGDYVGWRQALALLVSGSLSCVLAYWTVRLWSEDVPARERELEDAWQAGLQAIRKRGLSLKDLPLFLVVGCTEESSQSRFLNQSSVRLALPATPSAPNAPLRWFVAEDRVFLFCSDVGMFSALQSRLAIHAKKNSMQFNWNEFEQGSSMQAVAETVLGCSSDESGFADNLELEVEETGSAKVPTHASLTNELQRQIGGTNTAQSTSIVTSERPSTEPTSMQALESLASAEALVAKLENADAVPANARTAVESKVLRRSQQNVPVLSSQETIRYQMLLADTCRLLRVARSNAAPINGVIAWVDGPQLMNCSQYSRQCGQALRNDCAQIQQQLEVLAPISIVVDRMQEVAGFTELVRRIGPERAASSALGEALELQQVPDLATVRELSRRSLRTVISSVYKCFQASHEAGQPGNHKLFQLVINCRGRLGQAISSLLVESMATAAQDRQADSSLLSGVYFTASGDKPTQRAFANEVLERVVLQQELLNWTQHRQANEAKFGVAGNVLAGLTMSLLALAVGQLIVAAL